MIITGHGEPIHGAEKIRADIDKMHDAVSWAVRTIWEEYAGWLHYEDETTELYGVPRSAVNADLAKLAGGANALARRAQAHVEAGCPLEAIHLLDVALGAEPQNLASLKIKRVALEHLLVSSGNTNLSETMWLKSEIAAVEAAIK
jgi:alkyl sulfatase BDS1-like metallo-beta-lactamase superfamily hydrolase